MKLSRIAWAARSLPEGAFASKEELFKYGTRGGSLGTRPQRAGGGGGGAIRRPKLECFSLGLPRRRLRLGRATNDGRGADEGRAAVSQLSLGRHQAMVADNVDGFTKNGQNAPNHVPRREWQEVTGIRWSARSWWSLVREPSQPSRLEWPRARRSRNASFWHLSSTRPFNASCGGRL